MLKKILLALLAIVSAFLVYVAFLPANGTVSRTAVVQAPPDAVFANINSLKKWNAWSPWAKLDPNAKNTFEGPESGIGSKFGWDGNNEVGTGQMTIIESEPAKHVKLKLDFQKPFEGTSFVDFNLQPETGGTRVNWTMSGERPYLQRVMCTLFNADKMVGDMMEKGLASLAQASKV